MKTKYVLICVALIGVVLAVTLYSLPKDDKGSIKYDETLTVQYCSPYPSVDISVKNIGEIDSEETAIEKARLLWEKHLDSYTPQEYPDIAINYDKNADAYVIKAYTEIKKRGNTVTVVLGVNPFAIIKKSGEVISVGIID